jgi:hypothetical protein
MVGLGILVGTAKSEPTIFYKLLRPFAEVWETFIGKAEANWLEREFEERGMLEVVKTMNGDKALGPDGYSIAFFQVC